MQKKGPGTFFLMKNPSNVNRFMENNGHPIVDCRREILPITGNFPTSEVQLPNEIAYSGFRWNGVRLTLLNCAALTTHCGGSMCDKQNLYRADGTMNRACSCMSNTQRTCATTIVMDLGIRTTTSDDIIEVTNFTSTWFVNNYIFTEKLAAHVKASHFTVDDKEDEVFESITQVLEYINSRGGFRVIGWAKRGMIRDQGAAGQQDNQAQRGYGQQANQVNNMVENAEVRYHIVRLDPTDPARINLRELNELKFTMNA